MTDTPADIARRTATRLADETDPTLAAAVEQALADKTPDQYLDPISLGALIVSIATLAWTIYHDHATAGARPPAEVLERRLRVEIGEPPNTTIERRDQVINIVVAETLREP